MEHRLGEGSHGVAKLTSGSVEELEPLIEADEACRKIFWGLTGSAHV